jgi:hypothetical protein
VSSQELDLWWNLSVGLSLVSVEIMSALTCAPYFEVIPKAIENICIVVMEKFLDRFVSACRCKFIVAEVLGSAVCFYLRFSLKTRRDR